MNTIQITASVHILLNMLISYEYVIKWSFKMVIKTTILMAKQMTANFVIAKVAFTAPAAKCKMIVNMALKQ